MVSFSRHIASLMRHEKSIVTYEVTFFLSKFNNQRAKWIKLMTKSNDWEKLQRLFLRSYIYYDLIIDFALLILRIKITSQGHKRTGNAIKRKTDWIAVFAYLELFWAWRYLVGYNISGIREWTTRDESCCLCVSKFGR